MSKEITQFVEGKDYVLVDGEKFFTKEAIALKYGIAEGTVSNKVREHNIKKTTVFGIVLFHDDPNFSFKKRTYEKGAGHDDKRFKQMSYNTLVSEVQKLINEVKFLNQQNVQMQHKQDEANAKLDLLMESQARYENVNGGNHNEVIKLIAAERPE